MGVYVQVIRGRPLGKWLYFAAGEFLIGSGQECHVQSIGPCVSRQHCLIAVDDTGVRVRDLGSAGGTLVNGVLLRAECPLLDGDLLQLGPLVLQMSAAGPAQTRAA